MGLKRAQIDQADGKICLIRKVEAEVGFVHGCRRVMGHRRMTVDAIDLSSGGREKITEDNKPAQVRRGNTNGHSIGAKYHPSDLQRPPDAAPVRR